ncbi:MAG TPA: alpha/beta hydrolase [Pirellulales bacterium]|nr:alpha/beta hydrolase [Pirellulales bacterium]
MIRFFFFTSVVAVCQGAAAAEPCQGPAKPFQGPVELLWPDGAPDAVGTEPADKPSLSVHRHPSDKMNGAAVIVCPGGGYGGLADSYEGHDVAEWFNTLGVTALVLKYRLAPRYRHPAPLNDAQRAIRLVRARAGEWQIDPRRIGILGFSAGGHLASTAGTHFDPGRAAAGDIIDRQSCRPDFLVLCYPVVTMTGESTHVGSRNNLLGENADLQLAEHLSNEKQVTPDTPPTFMFHTNEDSAVPPENSVLFYLALRKAKVPAELHVYEKGAHGVGLGRKSPALASWPGLLAAWLKGRGILER